MSASPQKKYSEEEEKLFESLAAHSDEAHQRLSIDEVRTIKGMFDRADKESTGWIEHEEIEEMLLRIGDDVTHRVMTSLVEQDLKRLSFPQFVKTLQQRLSEEESKFLVEQEHKYIQSMGIDDDELAQIENFRKTKVERQSFREEHHHDASCRRGSRRDSLCLSKEPTVPNDVDAYRHEFGLEDSQSPK